MYTFLRWVLMFVLMSLGGLAAHSFGVFHEVWIADSTKLSFVILIIFIIFSLICGKLSYRVHTLDIDTLERQNELGWFMSDVCFSLGLAGTLIGFLMMLEGFNKIDITQTQTVQQLIKGLGSGLGTALYTTLFGLIGGTLLKVQYFNLQYIINKRKYITIEGYVDEVKYCKGHCNEKEL